MSEAKKKAKAPALYLRASGWKTWKACSLSLILKDETPFPPDSDEFAAEGTKIHAAIESDLKGTTREKYDLETEAVIDFAVRVALTEAQGLPIRTEVFNSAKVKGITIGGTADALIDAETHLTVIDFKTGWMQVDAQTMENGKTLPNEQLKIYAHLNAKQGQKTWSGVIINARLNTISQTGPHPFDKKYLPGLAADAAARVAKVQTQVGNHCAYCPALAVCKPVRAAIQKWLVPGMDDGIKSRKADWLEMLSLAKPAEKLFDRVKSDALKYIELGGEIPGVSVAFSGGSRAWPRDMTLEALSNALGVSVRELVDTKTVSPAEAEKRGVPRDKIQAVAIQPMRRGLKVGAVKNESKN